MSDKILSQEEVDALMRGVSVGEIETETDEFLPHVAADEYNLITSKERVVRGKLPTLEIINEQFCKYFRTSLFNLIRKNVDVSIEGVDMMKYEQYINHVALPASFNIFQISPLRGSSILVLGATFIFSILDNYFGGTGKEVARVEGREFTTFEQKVIKKIVNRVFIDMQTSWKPVYNLDFVYNRQEMSPQFVNVVDTDEIVIVSSFLIEVAGQSSTMSICIPYSSMEPLKEKLYASYHGDNMDIDIKWAEMMEDEIRKISLELSSEIGRTTIGIENLLSLEVGDILMLDHSKSEASIVNVEDKVKFLGTHGVSNGNYAVKITELINKEGE
ncbi:MAG: flagellar motor switch protein FliM [Thermodesulfobacteriota bacterium]